MRRPAGKGRAIVGGTWEDREGNLSRDALPAAPVRQVAQAVRTHQPDENGRRESGT